MAKDWVKAVHDDILSRYDSHEWVHARWERLSQLWGKCWPPERVAAMWHEGRQAGRITTFAERIYARQSGVS